MGIYNSVIVRCPACRAPLEIQPKAVPGTAGYGVGAPVPGDLARAIDRTTVHCAPCNTTFEVGIAPRDVFDVFLR